MKKILIIITLGMLPLAIWAVPPGAPFTDYGPAKMALGYFFDHSGQDIFADPNKTSSILNTTGAQFTFAPVRLINFGFYVGGAEFDHDAVVDTGFSFNSNFNTTAGVAAKLFTPRFAGDKLRLFAFGNLGWFEAKDKFENIREIKEYHSGGGVQYQVFNVVNLILGMDVYWLDGDQSSASVASGSNPFANRDLYRSLVAMEFYPATNRDLIKAQPFISVAFRGTGDVSWHDKLGIKNASVSASIGLITDFIYGKQKERREED